MAIDFTLVVSIFYVYFCLETDFLLVFFDTGHDNSPVKMRYKYIR